MAAVIGALRAELSASIAQFQTDMGKAAASVRGFAAQAEAQGRRVTAAGTRIAGFGKTLLGVFSVGMFVSAGRSIVRMGDELQDTADQLNITARDLQVFQGLALDTGANIDAIPRALAFMTDALGDAERGGGALAKEMRRLGIDMGTPMQVLLDLADAVKNADTWAEKMAITTAALGRGGRQLVPLLNLGSDAIKRLGDEMEAAGRVASNETIAKLDRASDAWERLITTLKVSLADPFVEVVAGLTRYIEALRKYGLHAGYAMAVEDNRARGTVADSARGFSSSFGGLGGALSGAAAGGGGAPGPARTAVPSAPSSGGDGGAAKAAETLRAKEAAAALERMTEATEEFEKAIQETSDLLVAHQQSLANQLHTAQEIGELQRSIGGGAISSNAERLAQIERDLDQKRIGAALRLAQLESTRDELIRKNQDGQQDQRIADLNAEIALEQQLHGLVMGTSAAQIHAAEQSTAAWKNLTDGLSSSLSNMLMEWEFDIESLKSVFKQFINELLIKPAISEGADIFGDLLKNIFSAPGAGDAATAGPSFAGGFAEGGQLNPGQWGIAGENGPEPIFGGRTGATVMPNSDMGRSAAGGDTYNVDMRGASTDAVQRLERFVMAQARGERNRWKINFAANVGSLPR